MPLDTSSFWTAVDGLETVSYYVKNAENTFAAPVAVSHAKRRAASKTELTSAGLLGKQALTWHLWTNQLAGIVPKINDKFTDAAGVAWCVKAVDVHSFKNRYRLTCVLDKPPG